MNWREVFPPLVAMAVAMALFIIGVVLSVLFITHFSMKAPEGVTVIRVCHDGTLVLRDNYEAKFTVVRPGAQVGWTAALPDVCAP